MIISICIPCMNRTYDLRRTLPYLVHAANTSPPVEIVILDYNSQDDLSEYMRHVAQTTKFVGGSFLTYRKYARGDYFHMAHSRNLSVLASCGEFIVASPADVILHKDYFAMVREALDEDDYVFLYHHRRFVGVLGCSRKEFIDAGGYDERFEFYGKEDKDILLRLKRRGGKSKQLPTKMMLGLLITTKEDKFKNYRLKLSRKQIKMRAKQIYLYNIENEVLVANKDGWGKWQ